MPMHNRTQRFKEINSFETSSHLAHNIIEIDTAETSKQSLLAAMHWGTLLSSAIACKIPKQKTSRQVYNTNDSLELGNNDELF